MWILDSLAEVKIKKPFMILWLTLGAAFLLLANFFSRNALYHPLTYALTAVSIWVLWQKNKAPLNGLILPGIAVAAFLLFPDYLIPFSLLFTFAIGKVVFAENFRIWKWLLSSGLLLITFPIVGNWQNIPEVRNVLPYPYYHLIHAAVHAFCIQFSLLPFQLRKDSVLEAFDHYTWKTSSDAYKLASETVALYSKIQSMIRTKESNPKIEQDLEDYTERVLHQSYRLQEISGELSKVQIAALEQQISFLKEKLQTLEDITARIQYEQALHNKEKQMEQYEKLQMQYERLLAQIINYNSSLENVRFAYANQDLQKASGSNENIEMFMDLVKARAEGFAGSF
ncbi:hypothetical protein L0222_15830 [bacterium]|nr:hypothetical protein [bacterium]MCI0601611.1 hypothetical protein [bacterium]